MTFKAEEFSYGGISKGGPSELEKLQKQLAAKESEAKTDKKIKEKREKSEEEKQKAKEQRERISQIKEKLILIDKKESPKERANFYLKLLEETKTLENKKLSQEIFEKTIATFKEETKEWQETPKEEKIKLFSQTIDLALENKLLIVDKEKKSLIFEEIFNLWQKEIPPIDSKKPLEKLKNSNELNLANELNRKALESALFLSWNLKEPWHEKETKKALKKEEKEETIINFTKKYLEENNPLKGIEENKELKEALLKENPSLIFAEKSYQDVFSILYLKGASYQELEPFINQTLKEKPSQEKLRDNLINFLNLTKEQKEEAAQNIIKAEGFSAEKFVPKKEKEKKEEKEDLEKLTEEVFFQVFEILKQSDPTFASKLQKLLETPEGRQQLQKILDTQKKEIENLYQEIEKKEGKETAEEIKKEKEKVKTSLIKAGLSFSFVAFLTFSAILFLKSLDWANEMAKKASQTKIKF